MKVDICKNGSKLIVLDPELINNECTGRNSVFVAVHQINHKTGGTYVRHYRVNKNLNGLLYRLSIDKKIPLYYVYTNDLADINKIEIL
jgi:hypothetical protein